MNHDRKHSPYPSRDNFLGIGNPGILHDSEGGIQAMAMEAYLESMAMGLIQGIMVSMIVVVVVCVSIALLRSLTDGIG